jgi:hypothetical protein
MVSLATPFSLKSLMALSIKARVFETLGDFFSVQLRNNAFNSIACRACLMQFITDFLRFSQHKAGFLLQGAELKLAYSVYAAP